MPSKNPLQSKVLWFNVSSIIAAALTALMASPEFLDSVGAKGYIGLMIAGALVNAILRAYTEKPIKIKQPPAVLSPVDAALRKEAEDDGMV